MRTFRALAAAIILTFAAGVFAQDKVQLDLYNKFVNNYKKGVAEQAVAREAVKQYLEKYGSVAKTEQEKKAVAFVTDWAAKYDTATRGYNLFEAIKAKKTDEAFQQAKQVFIDDPEDVEAYYRLAILGYEASAAGNRKNDADALGYATKAISLFEAGKNFDPAKPLTEADRANALGHSYFLLASLESASSPANARTHFLKAIATGTTIKTDPSVYLSLYNIYEQADYPPLAAKYNAECKSERAALTQTCIDTLAQANAVMDKMVDAIARAVAYANASPTPEIYAQAKAAWLEAIRPYYKRRNKGSDAGLDEFIKGIIAKPMPN